MKLRLLTAFLRLALLRAAAGQGGDATFNTLTVTGQALFADGTASLPSIAFVLDPDTGFFRSSGNAIGISSAGAHRFLIQNSSTVGFMLGAGMPVSWSTANAPSTADTFLQRDGNGRGLSLFNGTNPMAFLIYNTTTGLERGILDWQAGANIFGVGTENADRPMRLNTGTGFNSRLVTASVSMVNRDFTFLCSTATTPVTILLLASPMPGAMVNAKKISTDANRLTIDGNGNLIDGLTTASTIAQTRPNFQLQFGSASGGGNTWHIL